MHLCKLLAVAGLIVAAAVNAPWVAAQEAAPQHPADIRVGSCAEPGDAVATLTPLVVPQGEAQGPDGATPVAQSATEVPLLVADLLGAPHAVMVHASAEQVGTPLACGEIGGVVGEDGSLTIGLQAMNGGKVSGTASFAPTRRGDGTVATVYLIDERRGRERTDQAVAEGSADAAGEVVDDGNTGTDGQNGGRAADGTGNVESPAGSEQDPGAYDITLLNPNVAEVLPGVDRQPGGDGVVDHPGRDRIVGSGRDKRGNGGVARAGEDGPSSE